MIRRLLTLLLTLTPFGLAPSPAQAQLTVIDPSNLIQNALNAARALEQVNNQVRQIANQIQQLENEARNLTALSETFAPDIMARLRELDQLVGTARGLALDVNQTRLALEDLYTGDYRDTSFAGRARAAGQQIDQARGALQTALLMQAQVVEHLRTDSDTLAALSDAGRGAVGALSAQQATNELLAFQAEQAMRLEALLAAQSRAEALELARQMEVRAQARAQHARFFGAARTAHPGKRPWN